MIFNLDIFGVLKDISIWVSDGHKKRKNEERVADNKKPFICTECPNMYEVKHLLKRHNLSSHHDLKVQCEQYDEEQLYSQMSNHKKEAKP